MKTKNMIEILLKLPPEAEVRFVYDGAVRGNSDKCYLSKEGQILIVDNHDVTNYPEDQPV